MVSPGEVISKLSVNGDGLDNGDISTTVPIPIFKYIGGRGDTFMNHKNEFNGQLFAENRLAKGVCNHPVQKSDM